MVLHGTTTLLEFSDMVNERVLGIEAYKSAARRGIIQVVQKGGGGHPALIDWASLPDRFKELVRHHLGGDPEVLARQNELTRHLVLDQQDAEHLDSVTIGGKHLGFDRS